jgi:DNA-binding MarR family transcriptional regulator
MARACVFSTNHDSMDPTEIAERSCLLLPSLTRILQTLVDKGYINRMPHPTDGRRLQITITPAGRAFIAANMAESERIMARFQEHLGKDKARNAARPAERTGRIAAIAIRFRFVARRYIYAGERRIFRNAPWPARPKR